ncbi:envelope glycoprotein M [Falconid herpesvirus 1]|uniref:Envelope glycoprotein M n=1 Tax=Falconid herpesvirus 1 TaxID=1510155 RepID=A0A068ERY5_9ALPH|nr:envelope glycoprotein M [Falconid herpesvirus 1]AID52710.1 envelope glycoprotein M [Falconid herpesvirus 1]
MAPRKAGGNVDAKIDYVYNRMWLVQVICLALSVVAFLTTLVVGSIHGAGFPCFFAAVTNYTTPNVSKGDSEFTSPMLGGVVPVLFFESWEFLFYFYATLIILLTLSIYLIVGGVMIKSNPQAAREVGGAAFSTSLIASPATILVAVVSVWLLQTVIVVLAYKLIVLAAVVYIVFFITFTFFYAYFCGRGINSSTYSDDVSLAKGFSSSFHRLVGNGRAFVINLLSGLYGASLVMVAIMIEMVFANSFIVKFWHVFVITLATTSILTVLYLLAVELLIARYVHMILGPYIGLLVGYGMLGTSAHDYMNRFAYAMGSSFVALRLTTRIVLGVFAALILIAMIVRIVRAILYHRRRFTRAYVKARRIKDDVKDRVRRLSEHVRGEGRGRRDRRDSDGDRVPLRQASYDEDGSDEESIYDAKRRDEDTDSEWDG